MTARNHVLVEFNIEKSALDAALPTLPCMRAPTISPLGVNGDAGFAVKLAVTRKAVAKLLPELKVPSYCSV